MVHVPLQMVTKMLARAFERETGVPVFTPVILGEDRVMMLGRTLWQGDVALVAILAATLAVSALTYFWIEAPCRRFTRRLVDRRSSAKPRAESNLALP
jgi:peptidoglycan/LPS O-acetylase OafA/YrhL